jgi:type I restriction enzyme S subunit
MPRANWDFIGNLPALVPPLDEQKAIAAFLDRETARIDALIEKKRRQIELLQEKRAALISHAVTKGLPAAAAAQAGLDPNAPMKDSGIEWLGQIPKHWEVCRLKYLFRNLDYRRVPLSSEVRADMEKTYPYYGASGVIDAVEDYIFDEPLILVAEDGANLLSRSTPLAFIATGKYWVNNHAHILKPLDGPLEYWEGVLRTFDYTPLISGAAQPKLTAEDLGTIPLPHPPVEEQRQIPDALTSETGTLDAMSNKISDSIEMLREHRTALISAAVTGKIDVRGEVV